MSSDRPQVFTLAVTNASSGFRLTFRLVYRLLFLPPRCRTQRSGMILEGDPAVNVLIVFTGSLRVLGAGCVAVNLGDSRIPRGRWFSGAIVFDEDEMLGLKLCSSLGIRPAILKRLFAVYCPRKKPTNGRTPIAIFTTRPKSKQSHQGKIEIARMQANPHMVFMEGRHTNAYAPSRSLLCGKSDTVHANRPREYLTVRKRVVHEAPGIIPDMKSIFPAER
eukprot:616031-Amorphochlora_amoeboformis.AAC.1